MDFQKYPSIENSYRQLFLDKIIAGGLSGGKWVVQEKIHGANFSIYTNGETIKAAKRTGFLERKWKYVTKDSPGDVKGADSFFNYKQIIERYSEAILDIFKNSMATEELVLYGELFGGSYPHESVKRIDNAQKVQKGVLYCPQNEFAVFDIKVDRELLDIETVKHLLGDHDSVPFIPILFSGTFEECLAYKNDFQTTIPNLFDLPSIDDNTCEGIVIKPTSPLFLACGSRVILKSKNEKFSEKTKEPKPPPEPLTQELQDILDNVSPYITENRLRNVLSKIGDVTNKDFGKILGLFVKDTIEDFMKDDDMMESLEKKDRKRINKLINAISANLIRGNFLNIIDGVF